MRAGAGKRRARRPVATVDLSIRGRVGLSALARARLRLFVQRMVTAAALRDGLLEPELGLLLCDDAQIHELNRAFRNKDRPTDVLAFAQREGPAAELHPNLLGDIVISVATAKRQARGPGGIGGELRLLAAHGLCHLLGYDHRTDREEALMNRRVAGLLAEGRRRGPVGPA